MIIPLHPWQYRSGASHRVYLDTPPLIGSCWSAIKRSEMLTANKGLAVVRALSSALGRFGAL